MTTTPAKKGDEAEEKGDEIARCLGYLGGAGDAGDGEAGGMAGGGSEFDSSSVVVVDLRRLRSLAVARGGLLDSRSRRLGWTKLAGVDELLFRGRRVRPATVERDGGDDDDKDDDHDDESPCEESYDEVRLRLERDLEVSRWHVGRERRRLLRGAKLGAADRSGRALDAASSAARAHDDGLSSMGSESHPGTPKSVTFLDANRSAPAKNAAGTVVEDASSTTSYASFPSVSVDTTFAQGFDIREDDVAIGTVSNDSLNSPAADCGVPALSPLSLLSPGFSPAKSPQDRSPPPSGGHRQRSQTYQRKQRRSRVRRDRRPRERKLLVQIAASAFHSLQARRGGAERKEGGVAGGGGERGEYGERQWRCYPGLQDLVAVLWLHLESPSLTSLVLRRVLEGPLRPYCRPRCRPRGRIDRGFDRVEGGGEDRSEDGRGERGEEEGDDESFATCRAEEDDGSAGAAEWDVLSLAFFPVLRVVDEELHRALVEADVDDDDRGEEDDGGVLVDGALRDRATLFAGFLREWTSTWFCARDDLPSEAVARLVDFFFASHPSMPFYMSMAVLCHPVHRSRFLLLSERYRGAEEEVRPRRDDVLAIVLERLFSDLPAELSARRRRSLGTDVGDCDAGGSEGGRCDADEGGPPPRELLDDVAPDLDAAKGEGDGGDRCAALVVAEFFEEAVVAAASYVRRVPPDDVPSLVRGYGAGVLRPLIDPEEFELGLGRRPFSASYSSWTTRSSAPSDYGMIRRTFRPPGRVGEASQTASDASGLPLGGAHSGPCGRWSMTPAKAIMVGIAMFALLELHKMHLGGRSIGILSEEGSGRMALSLALQSMYSPPTRTDEAPDDDAAAPETSREGSESRPLEAPRRRPRRGRRPTPGPRPAQSAPPARPAPSPSALRGSPEVRRGRPREGGAAQLETAEAPRTDEVGSEGRRGSRAPPPSAPDDSEAGYMPTSPEPVGTGAKAPPEQEQCHALLGGESKHKDWKSPTLSKDRSVKRAKSGVRKLSKGLKKVLGSLGNFKRGYISLVENDDFFL